MSKTPSKSPLNNRIAHLEKQRDQLLAERRQRDAEYENYIDGQANDYRKERDQLRAELEEAKRSKEVIRVALAKRGDDFADEVIRLGADNEALRARLGEAGRLVSRSLHMVPAGYNVWHDNARAFLASGGSTGEAAKSACVAHGLRECAPCVQNGTWTFKPTAQEPAPAPWPHAFDDLGRGDDMDSRRWPGNGQYLPSLRSKFRRPRGRTTMNRHRWKNDVCAACGLQRHGYQGGKTGSLLYVTKAGTVSSRAGACGGQPRSAAVHGEGVK